jgi:hypothetical protein
MFTASLSASIILGFAMFGFVVLTVGVVGIATVIHNRKITREVLKANDNENRRRGAIG